MKKENIRLHGWIVGCARRPVVPVRCFFRPDEKGLKKDPFNQECYCGLNAKESRRFDVIALLPNKQSRHERAILYRLSERRLRRIFLSQQNSRECHDAASPLDFK